ncbi:MAG TPA: RdgB/HAM1 family non-canonical purine NTP pyrophosphatase [Levilinea sp.]|nr:RdgB/HAM1 family non-canonical purine NTP pyrophosphatase [Levilinea sp.]
METLLLATNNRGKRAEMLSILRAAPSLAGRITLVTPAEIHLELNVAETGNSYAENAALKAAAFCKASGLIALADDSGLEVAVLDGSPGIHSAHYSSQPGATDADRRKYLLAQLAGMPRPWKAHFHCTVAIAAPGGELYFSEGRVDGEIIPEERGTQGFGYDRIFYLPGLRKTMAEMSMIEKNRLSHRARAIQAALSAIEMLFSTPPAP